MVKVDDMKTIAVALVVALLPGMAISVAADADQITLPEQALFATARGTPDVRSSAVETMRAQDSGADQ